MELRHPSIIVTLFCSPALLLVLLSLEPVAIKGIKLSRGTDRVPLVEGDIVMPRARPLPEGVRRNSITKDFHRWPNGQVVYAFEPGYPPHAKALIRKAMDIYEKNTCISFKERSKEKDYVYFIREPGMCYSYVGKRGGRQELALAREGGCDDIGSILHEIGHAIGFWHEHNRSDRDNHVTIIWKNVVPSAKHNFDKLQPWNNRIYGPFDFDSVMIYGPTAFSKDGRSKTIVPKRSTDQLGEIEHKKTLSKVDLRKIKHLYKCLSNENGVDKSSKSFASYFARDKTDPDETSEEENGGDNVIEAYGLQNRAPVRSRDHPSSDPIDRSDSLDRDSTRKSTRSSYKRRHGYRFNRHRYVDEIEDEEDTEGTDGADGTDGIEDDDEEDVEHHETIKKDPTEGIDELLKKGLKFHWIDHDLED